jgi:putative phosphoesterase
MINVGLLSDVHASPKPAQEALSIFRDHQVDIILCAGDIAGYGVDLDKTTELLIEAGCLSVLGNHDLWHFERRDQEADGPASDYLRSLSATIEIELAGTKLTMVHASPSGDLLDGIRLLDERGDIIVAQAEYWTNALASLHSDILIVGHTHQVFAEQLGEVLVINPGSTLFNHSCAILSLPGNNVEFFPLCGKAPIRSWNFSMFKETEM